MFCPAPAGPSFLSTWSRVLRGPVPPPRPRGAAGRLPTRVCFSTFGPFSQMVRVMSQSPAWVWSQDGSVGQAGTVPRPWASGGAGVWGCRFQLHSDFNFP